MNNREFDERLQALGAQLEELNSRLEDAREQRNTMLRKRFDLKEQRRYLRGQLREAQELGNSDRAGRLSERLEALQETLDELDEQITEIENVIEATNDSMDEVREAMEDAGKAEEDAADEPGFQEEPFADKWESTLEKLNLGLQKGLQKVADTLDSVDFETLGQDVSSAVSRAAKTARTAATEAARDVENAWNEAKDNRQKPGGVGDYRISGSGVLDGGCYHRISCSGACKVSSDLVCRELSASGSFRACGSIDCSGEIRTSGAFHCAGDLESAGFSGTGSVQVQGNLKSGLMNIPGSIKVGGNLSAGELRVSGSISVGGDCEADSFTSSGAVNVGGMINADTVNIRLSRAQSAAGSIGGAKVTVSQSSAAGLLSSILKPGFGTLSCDSIEGDQLDLAGVKAATVRGSRVVIGSGCVIDRVEYTETCSIAGDAQVGACVKV